MISIITATSLHIVGCERMETRWQKAQSLNTIAAYQDFAKRYPKSPLGEEAKKRGNIMYCNSLIEKVNVFCKQNQYDEALASAIEAFDIAKNNVQLNDPLFAICINNLAEIFEAKQNYFAADSVYNYILNTFVPAFGANYNMVSNALEKMMAIFSKDSLIVKGEKAKFLSTLKKNNYWNNEIYLKQSQDSVYKAIIKEKQKNLGIFVASKKVFISKVNLTKLYNWDKETKVEIHSDNFIKSYQINMDGTYIGLCCLFVSIRPSAFLSGRVGLGLGFGLPVLGQQVR